MMSHDVLFAAYVIAISTALANPARIDYGRAYEMTQAMNVAALFWLARERGSKADAGIATALGVALAARASGQWQGGSRWDSLLVMLGFLLVFRQFFFLVVPPSVPHRVILYLTFTCLIMPILAAVPHIGLHLPVDDATLTTALSLSQAAYGISNAPTAATPVSSSTGPLWELYDPPTDTKAALTTIGSDVYIYFAGSESLVNWKTDLNILPDTIPASWGCDASTPMGTHKGFLAAFNTIATSMLRAMEIQLPPTGRIICTGHSLGAALATMAAVYIACSRPALRDRLVVITYGSPQVGDNEFVNFFNAVVPVSVRVANPMDPVPRSLNAQLVHVKGYYPVGSFNLTSVYNAHGTYSDDMELSPLHRTVAAFLPPVAAAVSIAGIIAVLFN